MKPRSKNINDVYVSSRFYVFAGICMLVFITAFFITILFPIAKVLFGTFVILAIADLFFLFSAPYPFASRIMGERLSNGDENNVKLDIRSNFPFGTIIQIIDELPAQFQERNFCLKRKLAPRQQLLLGYTLKPTKRGLYNFGNIILYVQSGLGLIVRRCILDAGTEVGVYPSFLNLRNVQLLSNTNIDGGGNRRVRKIGQSMEFEKIKDYVNGDDIRTINWKATARKGQLMVNNYTDEKSQQVYCIIDKGRLMKMPFAGLSLLDYAINSVLALQSVCLQKQDKIGVISFSNKLGCVIAADRKPVQRDKILQALYAEKTDFLETDFELLYTQVRNKIKQRSLVIIFTNFETLNGLNRQLGYLRSIARHHLVLVVFFENTELTKLSGANAETVEDVYVKTIAEKFVHEKKLVVKELLKYGIRSVLSSPEQLTVNTINKYLELKAKQAV